jgi:MFS family permease
MRRSFNKYPRSLWLMLGVFFCNRAAAALIWPFLSLYMRESLGAPLETVTLLISLQSLAGLLATSVIGVIMDRFGRKKAMAFGLLAWSAVLIGMSSAHDLGQWAILLIFYGIFQPAFYVGAFAMVADMVEPDERAGAYALARTVSNLAIAIGPAAGALFIAATHIPSYHITATINILLLVPFLLLVAETAPQKQAAKNEPAAGGYRHMARDRAFLTFFAAYLMLEFAVSMVFTLMPVYVKENYGIPQEQYSLLLSVNAGMIVVFQVATTRLTSRYRPLLMLIIGTIFYTLGIIGYAFSSLLLHFVVTMAVMTVGELIVAPTSASYVANLAPVNMRARYMGIFSVAYTISSGIGPMIGGYLSDHIAPAAIWYGGAAAAMLAVLGYTVMYQRSIRPEVENQPAYN